MNNNHRQFLIRMAFAFSLLLLGNLIFNVSMDIYQIFGTPTKPGINAVKHGIDRHTRIAKAYAVTNRTPEIVMLGSSRAESTFDPRHPIFSGLPTYNLAFSGAAVYEQFRYLQHAADTGQLKKAMVALDFHQFLDDVQKLSSDFQEERLGVDSGGKAQGYPWFDVISLVASGSAFKESWWSFAHQRNRDSIYRPDGYREDSGDILTMMERVGGQKVEFLGSEKGYVRVYRSGASALSNYIVKKRAPEKDVLGMLALGKEQKIDLIFIIPPVHARHLALIKEMGLWSTFENWQQRLTAMIGEQVRSGQCAIWDFATINEITTEPVPAEGSKLPMKWWRESSHASSAAGWKMLDVIQSGKSSADGYGNCLTVSNIDAVLAGQRRALSEWESRNPADLAEIQSLVRNGS